MSYELPSQTRLGVKLDKTNPSQITSEWLSVFSTAVAQKDDKAVAACFLEDGFWLDYNALTWYSRNHSLLRI